MSATTRPDSQLPVSRYLEREWTGPTALRIVLGAQLRRLRQRSGISRQAAGERIRGSHTKISRLELGQVSFKERDLEDLLSLYGVVDGAERAGYLALARRANVPGWWHPYSDVLEDWFELHIGLEGAASSIGTYEVQFLPGLLQTEAYAQAVTRLGHPTASLEEVNRRVELRMARQEALRRGGGPRLWAVVDEAVLRRPFGGAAVMKAQLEHLLEMSRSSNVTLQVAPFSAGDPAAAGCPITILRFDEHDLPDLVYLEQLTGAVYLDKEGDLLRYSSIMERLRAESEPPAATEEFLQGLLSRLG
uniref:helix-turn-helix domain-containing protein n=1 Tax=Streptomyces sp. TP-A0874 TaxID=549819 RepID=UPI000852B0A6|nr:helix-turn-helix transcriptional regulator [Streptomyces sp. TP-A0874]